MEGYLPKDSLQEGVSKLWKYVNKEIPSARSIKNSDYFAAIWIKGCIPFV